MKAITILIFSMALMPSLLAFAFAGIETDVTTADEQLSCTTDRDCECTQGYDEAAIDNQDCIDYRGDK